MSSDQLPRQIQLLVDSLRKQNSSSLSLADVASVTEVLIGTMQIFFRSIDTSIYRECRALSDYISNARKEIAALQPGDLESARIPRAGLELDAIVQQTEEATNSIMEAAEEIMALDPADMDKYVSTTQDAMMRIFEACSFQDITGQRISKVVETLAHIEQRVTELRNLLGVTEEDIAEAQHAHESDLQDRALLSGPALEGEGINQTEVDALMGGAAAQTAKAPAEAPAPPPPPAPAPKAEPKPAPKKPEPPKVEPPKAVSPKQLDSMFQEDFDPVAEHEAKEAEKAAKAKAEAEARKKADKKKDAEASLPAGEEVSQDDIDALFG